MVSKIVAGSLLALSAVAVIHIFWNEQIKYAQPTAVPAHYKPVAVGDTLLLPMSFEDGTAYFLHFYNPDCPCSRFNARHIESLINDYGSNIRFLIIVADATHLQRARTRFGVDLAYVVDSDQRIAQAVGVYSTPQAAIVTGDHSLYYRGNYNRSRYCTTRATNFAELSLLALINGQPAPDFGLEATQSYGCELEHTPIPLSF